MRLIWTESRRGQIILGNIICGSMRTNERIHWFVHSTAQMIGSADLLCILFRLESIRLNDTRHLTRYVQTFCYHEATKWFSQVCQRFGNLDDKMFTDLTKY